LAAVITYGLLDEFTQPLTGRDFDWFDWAADIGGAAVGAALSMLWRLRR
jgi:VanZ family protein